MTNRRNGAAPGGIDQGQAQEITGGTVSNVDHILSLGLDRRYEVPEPSDREVLEALAVVAAAGYSIAVRCTRCGHPLVTATSVARHQGPRCAAKGVQA
ncbi:hypothetical protein Q3O43_10590 [Rhodococcus aetherivorans]|uniref:DUF6011 domain-containing protein n=1 Tax=Rhodococcus aetherivorans TaxID=191292 RepID=UPI0026E9A076|nr:hypothetical protein [Rhodococcus aetherivorans]WKX00711.1 hypothetical protein Q3O43_10590 [Rhodococcus aetherivorans]